MDAEAGDSLRAEGLSDHCGATSVIFAGRAAGVAELEGAGPRVLSRRRLLLVAALVAAG